MESRGNIEFRKGVPTVEDMEKIIDDLTAKCMDKMGVPEYERYTDLKVYPIGESDFLYMICFRDEVIGSVLHYESSIISTSYVTDSGKEIIN